MKIPLGILAGAVLTALARLALDDDLFVKFVSEHWQSPGLKANFSGFAHYRIELYTIGIAVSLLVLSLYSSLLVKVFILDAGCCERVNSHLGVVLFLLF